MPPAPALDFDRSRNSRAFTGFLIYCCARAVDPDRHLHGYRDWRNRLVLFEDVDVFTTIERRAEGRNEVHRTIIRAANRKSVGDIHRQIRRAQSEQVDGTAVVRSTRWVLAMPAVLRRLSYRFVTRSPHLLKKHAGPILVTSLGMFGTGVGWGIPLPTHTLTVTVGGIATRPATRQGQVEDREFLCLTLSFDHDIVDGAPAARVAQRLKELIESGDGLPGSRDTP